MIGPVFGHERAVDQGKGEERPKKGTKKRKDVSDTESEHIYMNEENTKLKYHEINRLKPIGILQMINKVRHAEEGITEYDRKKFEAVQNLIGMGIDNTSE